MLTPACRQHTALIGALALLCVAGGALGIPASPSGPVPRLTSGVGCGQSALRGRNGSPAAAAPGLKMRKDVAEPGSGAVEAIDALRGGGLPKKLGGKNVGLLVILLSLLYLPRAMAQCSSRLMPQRGAGAKPIIQRLGCGPGLSVTNMATLSGLAMVLVNSRNYDRHGRSKLKMRLTGAVIMGLGMLLIIAHAEPAKVSWYSASNAYVGLALEWWGFVSLFYNFTPKFVAQIPREIMKLFGKVTGKKQGGADWATSSDREKEVDRLNRWASSQAPAPQ